MYFGPGIWSTISALTEVFPSDGRMRAERAEKQKSARAARQKQSNPSHFLSQLFLLSGWRGVAGAHSSCREVKTGSRSRHVTGASPTRTERETSERPHSQSQLGSAGAPGDDDQFFFFLFTLYCVSRKCEGGLKEPRPLSSADENYQLGLLDRWKNNNNN